MEPQTATRRTVEELSAHGLLANEGYSYAIELIYPRKRWAYWTAQWLSLFGVALILTGVVFFFAYNWADLEKFTKLAIVQGAIVLCFGGAILVPQEKLASKVLLLSGSIFVGVFLAVFGQVYQTGADVYQLFFTWACLIFGFVLIARFEALWFVWAVILNIALVLFLGYTLTKSQVKYFLPSLLLLNGTFLVLKVALQPYWKWLQSSWTEILIVTTVVVCALCAELGFVFASKGENWRLGFFLALLSHALMIGWYYFRQPKMWAVSLNILALCLFLDAFLGKEIFDVSPSSASYLIMVALTLGIFGGALVLIRKLAAKVSVHDDFQ